MNIERGLTFFAGILVTAIVMVYTLGSESDLSTLVHRTEPNVTLENHGSSEDGAMLDEIFDLQALAEYQATLPLYGLEAEEVARARGKAFEQIADLQALADYQATYSFDWLAAEDGARQRRIMFDQIEDLQALAEYQAMLPFYITDTRNE